MTKDNRFEISLDFGYALHHCNVNKLLVFARIPSHIRINSKYIPWYIHIDQLEGDVEPNSVPKPSTLKTPSRLLLSLFLLF